MLTDTAIRNAKPADKPRRLADSGGLYLELSPAGGKLWRWKYRFQGKEKRLALGKYPDVRIVEARERMTVARKLLAQGTDPGIAKKEAKARDKLAADNTFEAIAQRWYREATTGDQKRKIGAESTRYKIKRWLEADIYPHIGSRPVADITKQEIRALVVKVKDRGAVEIAKRVHNVCERIFAYAVEHDYAIANPAAAINISNLLPAVAVRHHASVTTAAKVGELMRAIEGFQGAMVTQCALRLAPLVFVRPGELRHAEWTEIDLVKGEWRIPAAKMKMGEQHIVPLAKQAVAVLKDIQRLTGDGKYVFPSERMRSRPMSENTINGALRRLGYSKEEMTGHGFRSMASTLLHELGYPHAVIERQLSHGERNQVSASYNFAEYLPERRKMMKGWADYLDKLKAGAEVIPLHGKAV